MNDVFRTMIVPAALAPLARALASGVSPTGGDGMFACALSPTGEAPATHYCSSGFIGAEFSALLTDADALYAACQAAGASVTLQQCQVLVSQSDVSEDQPFDAFSRLNLNLLGREVT